MLHTNFQRIIRSLISADWRNFPGQSSYSPAGRHVAARALSDLWSTRARFKPGCLAIAWCVTLCAHASDTVTFDIPEQRADLALIAFAEQADRTLLFSFDETNDKTANGLSGQHEVLEALELLLAGTGLTISMGTEGQLSVVQEAESNGETTVKKPRSLLARIGTALTGAIVGSSAIAQESGETGAQNEGVIEEIVVTASKREESLMEVAQSIQYLSGEELEGSGVQYLDQIVQLIPGVSLATGGPPSRRYNARGTGASSTLNDSAVGFYVDGMPYYIVELPFVPDAEVFDLESIQVLRGPQGTLYGQGAMGGTILITTAQPDLEQFRARVHAGVSRMHEGGDGHTYDASISVPLIEDVLAASLTVGASQDPGLAEGIDLPGRDLDEVDRWYARLKVLWEPSDELSITGLIQHRDLDQSEDQSLYVSVDPPLLGPTGGIEGGTETEVDLFGLNIEWDAGFATLTSSTSYLTYEGATALGVSFFDPNLGNFLIDYKISRDDVETFNQELRLTSNGDGEWDWITGVSYTRGENPEFQFVETLEPLAFASTITDQTVTESSQIALFGEVSRPFMDGLVTPLIGLRYFRDDRDKEIISTFEAGGFELPLDNVDEDERFSLVSPRFNLRITPSDETMFFLNISRGFRSGTFNSPGDVASVDAVLGIPLDVAVPESTVWSYEVGGRFSLFDGSLLIEPSLYLADYEDYQFAGTLGAVTARISIEEVKATGAELLLQWHTPIEGLSLSMIGSANRTEVEAIDATTDALLAGLEDGEQVPYVPEWDFRIGVDYERPVMGDWTASVSAAYFRRDGQIDFNTPLTSPVVSDLSLRLALANQNWRATLWGKNLTDDEGPSAITGGLLMRWDRRSVGVTLEYTFE